MHDTREPEDFDAAVRSWVHGALDQGACTLAELLRRLPGVYPAEVFRVLGGDLGRALPAKFFEEEDGTAIPPSEDGMPRGWPAPHPLDYDWRFTRETVRWLADRCATLATAGGEIVLLGAPSLVPSVIARRPGNLVTIVDAHPAMIDTLRRDFPGLRTQCLDLVGGPEIHRAGAAVVVADPPWYPEHVRSFLWAARRACRTGGHVLLSFPPRGARPGIECEWAALAVHAGGLGLCPVGWEPAVLGYRSPGFERNALRAAGLAGVPACWRRGDLALFECVGPSTSPRPGPGAGPEVWEKVAVGTVRIKLRVREETGFQDPALVPLVPGDILPSVSRRDPRRVCADVWTAGNRVFRSRSVGVLRRVLQAVAAGADPAPAVGRLLGRELDAGEVGMVRRAAGQILELIRLEQTDEETAAV